jgi:hypothetical protein
LEQKGKTKEAIEKFEQAIKIDSNFIEIDKNCVQAYVN